MHSHNFVLDERLTVVLGDHAQTFEVVSTMVQGPLALYTVEYALCVVLRKEGIE